MHEILREALTEPGSTQHVVALLDSFQHCGPNGTHQCLVFEAMGPDLNVAFKRIAESADRYCRAKSIAKQVLLGLHCLHNARIAHGDLNPGNYLVALAALTRQQAEQLVQHRIDGDAFPLVKRVDGKHDQLAPRYLCEDAPLTDVVDLEGSMVVKLSDLSAGMKTPYRPPFRR